jgi:hypothetical protein
MTAATAAAISMPAAKGSRRATAPAARAGGAARLGAPAVNSDSSSSSRASPIELNRRLGSFSRQRRSSRVSGGERSDGSACHFGSSFRTFASVIEMSSPSNARRPVSISYSIAPNAQMSARRSTVRPRACSGDM